MSCLPRVISRVYGNRRSVDEIGGTREALRRAGFERVERLSNVGSSAVLDARSTGWNRVPTR